MREEESDSPAWQGEAGAGRAILLVAAHPDDETLGAGGQLEGEFARRCHIVCVTDGAPAKVPEGYCSRESYALCRRKEQEEALRVVGIPGSRLHRLEIPDQEASFHISFIQEAVSRLIGRLQPGRILTHPYEGGHPDHDSTSLAVHLAVRSAARSPGVIEFTSYHDDKGAMRTGGFLPYPGAGKETAVVLSSIQQERKRAMLSCYRSQAEMIRRFPLSPERFRTAPNYNYLTPPHGGTLFYERCDWGMSGCRWRELAAAAMQTCEERTECL